MNYSFEIEKIFEIIGRNLYTFPGKERLFKIKPFDNEEEIREEFLKIKEIKKIKEEGEFFFNFPDLSNFEKELLKEKIFLPSELFKFLKFFEGVNELYKRIIKSEFLKERFFLEYSKIQEVIFELKRIFDDNGEIKDNASPELFKIRHEKRKLLNKIFNLLKNKIEEIKETGFLNDENIRLQEGRFTILLESAVAKKYGVVHGYSRKGFSAYVEPFESIDIQNSYKEIEEEERKEIERICFSLSKIIWENLPRVKKIYEEVGEIDLLNAKVLFSEIIKGEEPIYSKRRFFNLKNVYHPLLYLSKKDVVPYNFELLEDVDIFIISGPNGGGKTVFLKTLGIIINMLKYGIPVPAASSSHFYLPNKIYGIGFETQGSIEEGESNFTSHLRSFKEILEEDDNDILVLVDEYMASTDPQQASALGFSIIKEFLNRGIKGFFVTHLNGIKILAFKEMNNKIKNVSFGFDKIKMMPTYKLSMDKFEESYAFEIAERVGIKKEIVERARNYDMDMGKILKEMKEKVEFLEKEYRNLIEEERKKIEKEKEEFKRKMVERINDMENEIKQIIEEIRREKSEKKIKKAKEKIVYYKKIVQDKGAQEIKIGEFYVIDGFKGYGEVIAIEKNKVLVKIGDLKVWVEKEKLSPLKEKKEIEDKESKFVFIPPISSYSISIRGLKKDDALYEVEKFIYDSYSKGLQEVRIIHGIGDGILKNALWEYLKKIKFVEEFFHPPYNEGGYGVTIVKFKND
ncbi:MAG: Smr/MutS family protein [candidate division WOR-3 bacterium]